MRLFFSVGEPSGDLHGANLIKSLRKLHPNWEFTGYGGPRMASAGCRLQADLTQLAIMWFLRALWHFPRFVSLLRSADRYFADERPDAVVLIDYPGFNWWVARRAHARGIPVFYYGTPQLWAWASYRVGKMRRYVDHVLCKLPFEERWFRERGCHATYVGHPYFDELHGRQLDRLLVDQLRSLGGPVVTLLPGSRDQEIAANADTMLRSAQLIAAAIPNVQFLVAAFNSSQGSTMQRAADALNVRISVYAERTAELIEAADCCLACSGSVSLELLHHAKPSVVVYRVSRVAFFVQSLFRRVRYITLVNLLTTENPFTRPPAGAYHPADPRDAHVLIPEYLCCTDRSAALARHVIGWLENRGSLEDRVRQMKQLRERVGDGGASQRAADYLSKALIAANAADTLVLCP